MALNINYTEFSQKKISKFKAKVYAITYTIMAIGVAAVILMAMGPNYDYPVADIMIGIGGGIWALLLVCFFVLIGIAKKNKRNPKFKVSVNGTFDYDKKGFKLSDISNDNFELFKWSDVNWISSYSLLRRKPLLIDPIIIDLKNNTRITISELQSNQNLFEELKKLVDENR